MMLKSGFLFVCVRSSAKEVLVSEKILLEFGSERELLELICSSIEVIRSQIIEPIDSHWSFGYEGAFDSSVGVLFRINENVDEIVCDGVERVLLFESSKHEAKMVLRGLK